MADRGRSVRGAGAFLLALSLLALVPAVPALGLSATACRVKDTESSVTKPSLQAAVTAARKGHHLIVRGVCHGITVIGKDLTITGIRPAGAARPALDGDADRSVVTIRSGARVTIRRLRITDGSGTPCGLSCYQGGGILNRGSLILRSVVVDHNATQQGGGIYSSGTLTLDGASVVRDNTGSLGGGIRSKGATRLEGSSSVAPNDGGSGGGIFSSGSLILRDSASIHDNTGSLGGGILNGEGGILKLNDSSSVHGNGATLGGGIENSGALTLNGSSSIHHNTATDGGGINNANDGIATLNDSSSVHDNTVTDSGGGIDTFYGATLAINDAASVDHNTAPFPGGGVYAGSGTVNGAYCGTLIHDNTPDDCAP